MKQSFTLAKDAFGYAQSVIESCQTHCQVGMENGQWVVQWNPELVTVAQVVGE